MGGYPIVNFPVGGRVSASRSRVRRVVMLASTALTSVVLCADPAWTQTSPSGGQPAEDPAIENVVISAQKRGVAEDAQRVPVALTVITDVDLEERHVHNLQDLTTASPNVTLTDLGTVRGFAGFTIRGLGVNTTIPSMEPAVGTFVDGIYLGMSSGAVLDVIDVENIEILRGPQGLLFGRNTTGGAVLINTRRPGDAFAVNGRFNYETGPQETVSASVEGPLGERFRAKLTGHYSNDDGWFTNQFDGRSFGASRTYVVRPTAMWTPSAAFDSTLIYERGSVRGDGAVGQNPSYLQGFDVSLNHPGYSRIDWESVTLESNWRAGRGVFTNLAGYRTLDQGASLDVDARPISGFFISNLLRQHQFSDELRFSGRIFDRVDLTAGLYYFTQSYLYLERRVAGLGVFDSTLGGDVDVVNYAAFAQVSFEATPQLALIAGGRFNREEKDARIATFLPSTALSRCDFAAETCIYNFPGPDFPDSPGRKTWDNFTPKLGFQWQAAENAFLYGHWARGVRSGGYNVRNASRTIPPGPYDPELQDAFELGLKTDWFDNRLRANATAFYNTIRGMQRDVFLIDPIVASVQVTRNTADATIQGFELEFAGVATDEWVLFANAGYTDGSYDEIFFDLDGGGIGDSDLGLAIPRLSPWSYAVGMTYTRDFPGGFTLRLRTDYGYRSSAASLDDNRAFLLPIEDLSASMSLTFPGRHWSLSLYGRNLLDNVTIGVHTLSPPSLGSGSYRSLNEGRVIGVEAGFVY
jgi:iron complex outermembrane receptor protein